MALLTAIQILDDRTTCHFLSSSATPNSLCCLSSGFVGTVSFERRYLHARIRPLWQSVKSVLAQNFERPPQRPSSSLTDSLNEEQRLAVQTDQPCVRVVAGPGSGNTRVLTERVAHLIAQHGVSPRNILFVTFTNKAAGEIQERLSQIYGSKLAEQLTVGTFHSICAKILRRHPCSGVNRNFVIFDDDDSEKLLKNIINAARDALSGIYGQIVDYPVTSERSNRDKSNSENLVEVGKPKHQDFIDYDTHKEMIGHLGDLVKMGFLKEGSAENVLLRDCLSFKEKTEANGWPTATVSSTSVKSLLKFIELARKYELKSFLAEQAEKATPLPPKSLRPSVVKMATLYENALRRNNAVDFDDLIHLVVRAFYLQPHLRELCQEQWTYILVDEFQDTDAVQYELIRLLASKHKNLFVVGDIDQAIYGWRGAEYRHMQNALKRDFPSVATFQLMKNYRSSANILKAASIVLQNSSYDRQIGSLQALSLVPTKGYMTPIWIGEFDWPHLEAQFIASEILKLVQQGKAGWGSFALLYRARALSSVLEASLINAQIPYRIVGSMPFYSYKEVKILLAYLQIIANPKNELALENCLNTPSRGIGKKTVSQIKKWATLNNISFGEALENIQGGSVTNPELGLRPKARNAVLQFMDLLQSLRSMSVEATVPVLLRTLVEKLDFKAYIRTMADDESSYFDGLKRLEELLVFADASTNDHGLGYDAIACFLEDFSLLSNQEDKLSSMENQETKRNYCRDKVQLMTLHAAKGLEFDCVFLTGASDSLIPLSSSDLNEERRLFYVGITRARERLYLTFSLNQFFPWEKLPQKHKVSRFIEEILRALPKQFCQLHTRQTISDENYATGVIS